MRQQRVKRWIKVPRRKGSVGVDALKLVRLEEMVYLHPGQLVTFARGSCASCVHQPLIPAGGVKSIPKWDIHRALEDCVDIGIVWHTEIPGEGGPRHPHQTIGLCARDLARVSSDRESLRSH